MAHKKLERFAEVRGFPNCLVLFWEDASKEAFSMRSSWNSSHFRNASPLTLELGCGKGEYTIELARRFPDRNFIGVDIKGNRLWKGAKIALDDKLNNVAFLRTRIDFIDKAFGPNEVEEIWITFPDPQKEKARKRLTHPMFLGRYRKFLKPDAMIHLKTDSDLLFEYTLDVISKENHVLLDSTNDLYENKPGRDEVRLTQTFYEKIFLKEGKKIKYLKFQLF